MTIANWDMVKSEPTMAQAIEGGRLRIDQNITKASTSQHFWHCRKNSDFSRGHTIGKIRTKIEVSQLLGATRNGFYGILCMMSAADLTGGSGSCYCFGIHVQNSVQWMLVKCTSGLEQVTHASVTKLAEGDTTLTPAVDTNYAIELQWAYHTLIGGTNFVCKVGLAENNFSDLVTVYDETDTSTPLTTSVGEGLFFADTVGAGATDLKVAWYDDTTIVPLAGIPL